MSLKSPVTCSWSTHRGGPPRTLQGEDCPRSWHCMYNTQAARGAAPGPLTAVRLIFPHGLPLRWRGCCSYICFPGTTQVRQIANDLLLVHHISRLTVWCRNIAHHQKAECRIESARGLESESSPRVNVRIRTCGKYALRIKASRKRWWPRGHAPALALVCGAVQSAIPRKTAQDSPSALHHGGFHW